MNGSERRWDRVLSSVATELSGRSNPKLLRILRKVYTYDTYLEAHRRVHGVRKGWSVARERVAGDVREVLGGLGRSAK